MFFLITRQLLAEHSVLALVVLQKSAACCGTKSMHPNIKTSPKNNVNDVNRAAESSAQRFFSSYLTVSIDWAIESRMWAGKRFRAAASGQPFTQAVR